MTLNKRQFNKIKKMKDYIESIFASGKIPKNFSPYDIGTAYSDLKWVYDYGQVSVVAEGEKKLFEKFGFNVAVDGIGWIVTI